MATNTAEVADRVEWDTSLGTVGGLVVDKAPYKFGRWNVVKIEAEHSTSWVEESRVTVTEKFEKSVTEVSK